MFKSTFNKEEIKEAFSVFRIKNEFFDDNNVKENVRIYRHEFKFLLDPVEFLRCHEMCKRFMPFDENADENGTYTVTSLYFDSIKSQDYFDKEMNSFDRKKIRLRTYNRTDRFANLEMKRKVDIYEYKEKLKLSCEQSKRLIDADYDVLFELGDETALNFYTKMKENTYRPIMTVEYDRIAFALPFEDIRFTFDTKIRYNPSNFDIFSDQVFTPALPDGYVVFEMKYNHILPAWAKKMMNSMSKSSEPVSKYMIAREFYL